jgi:serine/threonine protein phosphatase PrpC
MASDGLWDNMSPKEAIKHAKRSLLADQCVIKAADALVEEASKRAKPDNVTCIVIVNLVSPHSSLSSSS